MNQARSKYMALLVAIVFPAMPLSAGLAHELAVEEPEEFKLTGVVEEITDSSITINGVTNPFGENTEFAEGPKVGIVASVAYIESEDGSLLAEEVEVEDEDEDEADEDLNDDDDEHGDKHGSSDDDDEGKSDSDHDDDDNDDKD